MSYIDRYTWLTGNKMDHKHELILQILNMEGLSGRADTVYTQRKVLIYMAMRLRDYSWPEDAERISVINVTDASKAINVAARTVRNALARLQKDGHIERTAYQYGLKRRYTITI